ncbi:MAG: NTP transferase domain-containing protein, partial [Candidatus Latescibacteria bacterium]|nr:NTP transferase domain-containing protein [Candidatus Latescibacterota bacterium]
MTKPSLRKGVILAAGYGTRMAALTQVVPKPLLPIVNVPTLERILLAFRSAGISEALIITGYRADAVEAYCGSGSQWGMTVVYEPQTAVSGTGSATAMAREFAGNDPFMLTYGDILLNAKEYQAVADLFGDARCGAASALNRLDDVSAGSANYLKGNRIVQIIEKPPAGTSSTNLNSAGVFAFSPEIFDAIGRTPVSIRGEYELTEAVQTLISDGLDVRGHAIAGVQHDIGTPEAYVATNSALIDCFGSVRSGETSADNFAAPGVDLKSPVAIAAQCEIERSHLGPNVCIGEGARIGHSVSIQNSVIMPGADIGDGASVSYAIVGRNACVSNRARLHGSANAVLVVGDNA